MGFRLSRAARISVASTLAAWSAVLVLAALPASAGDPKDPPRAVQPGPNGLIVHFGDSFVDAGLRQNLAPKFAAQKTKYFFFGRRMTVLATWASGSELDELYFGFRPSLFLVTLGANDLSFPNPEQRVALVKKIVGKMRGTPCVWIGIPLWPGAPTGMADMFRRESAPCRYFDSTAMSSSISRQKDGRHPDAPGGAVWAEAVWSWILAERDPSQGPWALRPAPAGEHGPAAAASSAAASAP
ncbi:MAG: SGNH/GDSL hydrolase family protein [Deltaproteobacteria bacterium]|nr:SGNH/GDSL hydrolase family protein [Deltaproteobacteria bacterium]